MKYIFFILMLLLGYNNFTYSQNPIDLCKKSVSNYCKKRYTLYKSAEWNNFKKENAEFEDFSIDKKLNKLLSKKIQLIDTSNIKVINKYLINHNIRIKEDDNIIGFIGAISISSINNELVYMMPIKMYGKVIDTLKFYNKDLGNNIFLNYTSDNNVHSFVFDPDRETIIKQVYKITHTYEALTKAGVKRYFTSEFYINTKTYEILSENEL